MQNEFQILDFSRAKPIITISGRMVKSVCIGQLGSGLRYFQMSGIPVLSLRNPYNRTPIFPLFGIAAMHKGTDMFFFDSSFEVSSSVTEY